MSVHEPRPERRATPRLDVELPARLHVGDVVFDAQTIDVVGWTRVYLFTIPYVLMVYGAVALEKNSRPHVAPPWAVRIGDHSYSIYLTHVLVLSVCGRVWKTFAWQGYLDNVVILSATVVAVLLVGQYSFRCVERPLLNLSRRLIR